MTRDDAIAAAAAQLVTEDDTRDSLRTPQAVAEAAWRPGHPMSEAELAAYYAALRSEQENQHQGGRPAA